MALQITDALDGFARAKTHLIIDRGTKYCTEFRQVLESATAQIVLCPPRVPQCIAIAVRFVHSIKSECLDQLIFFGEERLKSSLKGFEEHFNQRRNHQGLDNRLLTLQALPREGGIRRRKELGGLLNYYYREAA